MHYTKCFDIYIHTYAATYIMNLSFNYSNTESACNCKQMLITSRLTLTSSNLLDWAFDMNQNYISKSRIKEVTRKFIKNPLTNVAILSPSRSWKDPSVANRYHEGQKLLTVVNIVSNHHSHQENYTIIVTVFSITKFTTQLSQLLQLLPPPPWRGF